MEANGGVSDGVYSTVGVPIWGVGFDALHSWAAIRTRSSSVSEYVSSGVLSLCESLLERLSRSVKWEGCVLLFGMGEAKSIMSSVWPGYGAIVDGAMDTPIRGLIGEVLGGGVGKEGLVAGCGILGSGLGGA